jgi:hypothetical protein
MALRRHIGFLGMLQRMKRCTRRASWRFAQMHVEVSWSWRRHIMVSVRIAIAVQQNLTLVKGAAVCYSCKARNSTYIPLTACKYA